MTRDHNKLLTYYCHFQCWWILCWHYCPRFTVYLYDSSRVLRVSPTHKHTQMWHINIHSHMPLPSPTPHPSQSTCLRGWPNNQRTAAVHSWVEQHVACIKQWTQTANQPVALRANMHVCMLYTALALCHCHADCWLWCHVCKFLSLCEFICP